MQEEKFQLSVREQEILIILKALEESERNTSQLRMSLQNDLYAIQLQRQQAFEMQQQDTCQPIEDTCEPKHEVLQPRHHEALEPYSASEADISEKDFLTENVDEY